MWLLTIERHVWPWCVHAKLKGVEDAKVTSLGSSADAGLGIVDEKSVLLGQERHLAGRGVLGVPDDLCLTGRLVDSDGVRGLVCGAGGEDVDGGGCLGQRGVVPGKSHVVANLVELRAGEGSRRDHGDASCGQTGVVAGRLGLGRGLAA